MSLTHDTFTLEREYPVSPAAVFRAFADPAIKHTWFHDPGGDWTLLGSATDFREGGAEYNESRHDPDGTVTRFDARYHEIVDGERIVYSYEMRAGGVRLSVSLTSIELTPSAGGTLLRLTEHGVYFDGHDDVAGRRRGVADVLAALARALDTHRED